MSKNEWKKWIGGMGRMLLAFALVFAQSAWAAQNQKTTDQGGSPQKTAARQTTEKQTSIVPNANAQADGPQRERSDSVVTEEKSSGGGSHEGIKVHGHWTIEVRNPDGTVATHREFENSLYSSGGPALINLLAGQSIGSWAVWVSAVPVGQSGFNSTILDDTRVTQGFPNGAFPGFPQFQSLNVSVNSAGQLVLSGNFVPTTAVNISGVQTVFNRCDASTTPAACITANPPINFNYILTSATVTPVVTASAGQTIQVTTVISFS